MKKAIFGFLLMLMATFCMSSCNNGMTENGNTAADTTLVADSDSVAVDSVAVVDSAAIAEVK